MQDKKVLKNFEMTEKTRIKARISTKTWHILYPTNGSTKISVIIELTKKNERKVRAGA